MCVEHRSLAQKVFGIADQGRENAVYEAYKNLTGLRLSERQFQVEAKRLDALRTRRRETVPWQDRERLTTLDLVHQIFDEGELYYINVLKHWPTYQAHYERLKRVNTRNSPGRYALQVGCLTAISAAAFSVLASDVYGAKPLTIDLTASSMRARHSDYAVTDALCLGIASNSMSVVQTSSLINMLALPVGTKLDLQGQVAQLLGEMYRVLRPGGVVVLHELTPGLNRDEFPEYASADSRGKIEKFRVTLTTGLVRASFSSIKAEPATEIDGIDYLFDPKRRFTQYAVSERKTITVVSAIKPA